MEDLERGVLARLKQSGVQIPVDDFGTGHSSLQYWGAGVPGSAAYPRRAKVGRREA